MSDRVIHRVKIEDGGKPTLDDSPTLLFPWWSFTKTVLAACSLKLVAQGRLKLDDTLPGRPYTLRQLLQHRAGVPCFRQFAPYHEAVRRREDPWKVDDLLERVGSDQVDFAPGKGWNYSNVGYIFVRRIIEDRAFADLGTAMQRLAFGPLDLSSARLALEPGDLNRTAWGNQRRYHPGWVYHGLVIGTAMDAARFLDGLMSGRLLSPDLLDIMKTLYPLGEALPGRPWEETGYGLGLMGGRMSMAGPALGHSGCGPGSVNAVYYFPQCHPTCTVGAFSQGEDEGVTEHAVDRLATR